VLAPTRELAAQIKAEAVKLLQPHGSNIGVQVGHFCFSDFSVITGEAAKMLQPHGSNIGAGVALMRFGVSQ
jgi:superfamily II DNA/RNA helicase